MPLFLNTLGNASLGIANCMRCAQKKPIGDLSPDRDRPGLMVCEACNDEYDPYKLPLRDVEDFSLPFVHYDTLDPVET